MAARHPPPVPIITGCILVQDILEPKGTRIISFFRVHKHSEPCCCSTVGLKGQPSFTLQDFATSSYRPWASSLILPTLISSLVKKKRGGKGKTIYLFHRANCLDMKDTQYSSWHRGGMLQISAVIISVPQTVLWSRQGNECYSLCSVVQSCLTLRNPADRSLPGSSVHGIFQARKRAGCHFLLQGIFPTQESNLHLSCLLNWQADSLLLCHLGSPLTTLDLSHVHFYRGETDQPEK